VTTAESAPLDFLLERQLKPDHTWVGASSNAMLEQALTGTEDPATWPMDMGDLDRCEETYRRAPAYLQALMLPTLERFRRHVAEGGLYCKGCDNSIGHRSTRNGLCSKCWETAPSTRTRGPAAEGQKDQPGDNHA
jgi:hypothetical protein